MNANRAFAGPGLAWRKLVPSYGRWRFMDIHSIPQRLLLTAGLLTLAACSDSTAPTRGATQGAVRVTATTTGADLPSVGYSVSVDSGAGQAVPTNGAVAISGLNAGRHSVTLYGIAANCVLSGVNTRAVDVRAGDTVRVAFDVTCFATGGAVSQLAFVSSANNGYNISLMNSDGSGVVRLTTFPAYQPAWSADGTKIAFSNTPCCGSIYIMNADGTGLVRLTNTFTDGDPAWSPDGSRIAFDRFRGNGETEIYVMNADGTGVTQLT